MTPAPTICRERSGTSGRRISSEDDERPAAHPRRAPRRMCLGHCSSGASRVIFRAPPGGSTAASPSSRGPGHRPFTAVTGVRIPLGTPIKTTAYDCISVSPTAVGKFSGFIGSQGEFAPFIELDHLRIMVAQPEYLFAMKRLAMRIGAEFHDEEDVRYLLRHLDIRSLEQALEILAKYYPLERFPQKTLYALEELLSKKG